jgi:uncharacterized membrane protein
VKKFLVGLIGCLVAVLWAVPVAYADVNDFTITNFEADYTLSNDDRQGTLRIKEHLDVEFTDNNHGILRAIPESYKDHTLHLNVNEVASPSGAPAEYTTYGSSGNTVLKIGDPDRTVTGAQSYTIDYTLRNVISFYEDYDELFWDINGDQWSQPFEKVSVALHLPVGLQFDSHTPRCYTGSFGSTEQACQIRYEEAGRILRASTTRKLLASETMSIVAGFQKGFFHPSTAQETAGEYAGTVVKFFIPLLLVGGIAGRHWYRYGRDAKGRGTIVPEYEAPHGLKAIEAGTIADFKTDNRDITATIIDLAIRGHLKIIETKNVRRFRRDTITYSLRLLKTDHAGLKDFEQSLLKAVFAKQEVNEEVDLSVLKYKLATEATKLRKSLKDSLTSRGYFRKTPFSTGLKFGLTLAGAFVASLILAIVTQSGAAILGLVLGSFMAVIFLILLPARTPQGVAAKESIMGLKKYLEVAESERIKKLQSPNAPYAQKSAGPKKTVELFEKLLPFAMVLGVEQQWAKQFEDIYRTPPDWYQGSTTHFSAAYLATSLNSGVGSSVNSAFSAPSSSGSSGFSGGGSGGGGGGGGGGGW